MQIVLLHLVNALQKYNYFFVSSKIDTNKNGATLMDCTTYNATRKSRRCGSLDIYHCEYSKFTSFFQRNNHIVAPFIGNSYCKGLLAYYIQQITLNNRFSILIE